MRHEANGKIASGAPAFNDRELPIGDECDGCPAEVSATVSFVSTEPEFTPPVIYSNENRAKMVFLIEARPADGGGAALRPGQPVEVVAP